MARTNDKYLMRCKHCGRQWDTQGRSRSSNPARQGKSNVTGFIVSASANHEFRCADKSPTERRATNAADEKRWRRQPPTASRIWNDPEHPGLREK